MKNTKLPFGLDALLGGVPIDWAAWEAEASKPRGPYKGKKYGPEVRARMSAAQKARFATRRAELAEALAKAKALDAQKPKPYDHLAAVSHTDRIFGSLVPGQWYARPDIATVSGVRYQPVKAYAVKFWKQGFLERIQNPAWKPPERVGMKQEPRWLYRLTKEGEKRHAVCAALL